ncbi:hypothetical protein [Methylorubrum extorquens]|uniref:hypothetical protein n=1 Tax=Methylorubrum extorquens TaxID=408 RepID=UPI00209CF166|nr:hypothetical protein [Methylorubrum extorquens]MCP1540124.1 hypothetical protein [Methylorubrum extorquens]
MSRQSLLKQEDFVSAPVEHGDAGVILKPDGSFKIFSTGEIDGANLTPEQERQGKTLLALAVALKFPEVMAILEQMSVDPNIVGDGIDLGTLN